MSDRIAILEEVFQRRQAGETFAIATVVRVEKPTSALPGDTAIISADGRFEGWVGGSCAQPTIQREALNALRDGAPRYVRLTPPEKRGLAPQAGVIEVPLTCISGGTLEVYIEPVQPPPQIVAIGHLPVISALVKLAAALDFQVIAAGLDLDPHDYSDADLVIEGLDFSMIPLARGAFIVVASHGNYDESAVEWALKSDARYVALVTSRKRGAEVVSTLRHSGLTEAELGRLKYPAGLDIGAQSPQEIAVSILAEIIEARYRKEPEPAHGPIMLEVYSPVEAVDPICGMRVDVATARFTSEFEGIAYYFCCQGCKMTFDREPMKYAGQRQG